MDPKYLFLILLVLIYQTILGTVIKVRVSWSVTVEVPKDRHEVVEDTGLSRVQVRRKKPQRKPQKPIHRMSSVMGAAVQIIRNFNSSLTCKLLDFFFQLSNCLEYAE